MRPATQTAHGEGSRRPDRLSEPTLPVEVVPRAIRRRVTLPHVQRGDDYRSKDGSGLRDSGLPDAPTPRHFPKPLSGSCRSGLRALVARPVWLLRCFPIRTADTRARGVMSAYRSSL